jgi:peptidyl-prolyl cis-trans isomerase D
MLKWLRKYSRSWFIALIIGAIAIVFVLWGVGGVKSPRFQEVAEVNGKPIMTAAYLKQFNELLKQYQEMSQGELTPEIIKSMRLKEQALNRLIDEELLQQGAERLGIKVSDAELQEQIRAYPFFQEEGQFSERRYQMVLSRNHMTPADFEAQERHRLLLQKTVQAITSFAKAADTELKDFYRLARETVEVRYLALAPDRFLAEQRPAEPEIAKYYEEHQDKFRTPARVKVKYLLFRPEDFREKAKPTPGEVADYLKEHSQEFARPRVIQARQLLLKVPAKAGPRERRDIENQAQALLRQARTGADFAVLARKFSQDERTKGKGGDLGEVKRGQLASEWDKVAFALKKGEVGLASTHLGFHLIKLEEVKASDPLPEAEARNLSTRLLTEQRSRILAQEAAATAREDLRGTPMAEVAKKFGVQAKETPLLTLVEPVPDLGTQPKFSQTAINLKPREISKVVELPPGFAVLQGVEHQDAQAQTLEQCKDKVRQAVSREKARNQAFQEAGKLLERLRKGEPLAKVAAQAGVALQESGPFNRFQGFLKQPQTEALTAAAFKLSSQAPYPPQPLLYQDKYFILIFKSKQAPTPEEYQKEKDKLASEYLEHKRGVIIKSWLAGERQKATIKVYEIP